MGYDIVHEPGEGLRSRDAGYYLILVQFGLEKDLMVRRSPIFRVGNNIIASLSTQKGGSCPSSPGVHDRIVSLFYSYVFVRDYNSYCQLGL